MDQKHDDVMNQQIRIQHKMKAVEEEKARLQAKVHEMEESQQATLCELEKQQKMTQSGNTDTENELLAEREKSKRLQERLNTLLSAFEVAKAPI
jgi:hypothetical protein